MSVVFYNPLQSIIDAAIKVSPDIDCIIQFDPRMGNGENAPPYGETAFDTDATIVSINGNIPISVSLEILAHELAHVIARENADHGDKWEATFQGILNEYNRMDTP